MYKLKKDIRNNKTLFLIQDDWTEKTKDFLIYPSGEKTPNIQEYVFSLIEKAIELEFEDKAYNRAKLNETLSILYNITIKNDKTIEFNNSFFFNDVYLVLKYDVLHTKLYFLKNKITEKGLQLCIDDILKTKLEEMPEKFRKAFENLTYVIPNVNDYVLFREVLKLVMEEDIFEAQKTIAKRVAIERMIKQKIKEKKRWIING